MAFRPVEGNSEKGASEYFINKIADDYYLAIINYDEKETYNLSLRRLGIEPGEYNVKELFSGRIFSVKGPTLKAEIGTRAAAIFRFTEGIISGTKPDVPTESTILYPNPANDLLTVNQEQDIHSLKVFSTKGRGVDRSEKYSQ